MVGWFNVLFVRVVAGFFNLMFGVLVCCLLSVVCCLLFVVCRCIVCCLLFDVRCLLFVVFEFAVC